MQGRTKEATLSNRTGTTTVDLNLRAGAGTHFAVLAVLPPNTPVEVMAEQGEQMFDAFSAGERNQLAGFCDFIQGPAPNSRRVLALQTLDFAGFAALYNGPGRAASYASLIQGEYGARRCYA